MKTAIIIFLLLITSCNTNNKKQQLNIVEIPTDYYIKLNIKGSSSLLFISTDNDTIYLYSSVLDSEQRSKIIEDKATLNAIKESIKYHLDINNFYSNHGNTIHGDYVSFYIEHSQNRLQANYFELNGYKDVSLKFDSLVNYLHEKDKAFKRYFPR